MLDFLLRWLRRPRPKPHAGIPADYLALKESHQHLQTIFNQAAVGIALVNMETGRFERVNQRYADILGYTRQELNGQLVFKLSSPDDDNRLTQTLRDELRQGKRASFHIEKRQIRKDGQTVWIDLTVAPVEQDDGLRLYDIGVIQDITERRQMQDALRVSEAHLRNILDHLPLGILQSGSATQRVFYNRNFMDMTGYSSKELVNPGSWWRLAFPDASERHEAKTRWSTLRAQAAAQGGLIERSEYNIRRADGTFCSMAISGILLDTGEIAIFEDLSRYKAAEEQINYLAYYDSLTGLANRRLLKERLAETLHQGIRSKQCGAVLMLGLDRFKTLNEARGHSCGDQLLRQVAQQLRACLQPDDTLARYAGDTFVLVMAASQQTPDKAAQQASQLGQKILLILRSASILLDGQSYRGTASIGVAVFQGQDETPETLLQQVDMAMYQAKANGRNTLAFYDTQTQARISKRAKLEADLQIAIEQGQLQPYFQPQVRSGQIVGAEVLVRWPHPSQGLISPAQFIPLAEETGLIIPLGGQILRAACLQLAQWQQDPVLAKLTLSVNISPLQFYREDFVDQVLDVLQQTGANSRLLGLEITESLLLQNVESTVIKMQQLKAQGLRFALDDFGTGYSSLAYLKRLPLDELKIDQSFVQDALGDASDAALVRTIVSLGDAFGLQVIAEGVETDAQRRFLQAQGCLSWQGYLFGRPTPVDQFEKLVHGYGQASA